jgi:hypothetical protein
LTNNQISLFEIWLFKIKHEGVEKEARRMESGGDQAHQGGKFNWLYVNNGLKMVKDVLHEFYDLNHNMPKDL